MKTLFRKGNKRLNKVIEVQIEIKSDAEIIVKEGALEKLLEKVKKETKDIPHVRITLKVT